MSDTVRMPLTEDQVAARAQDLATKIAARAKVRADAKAYSAGARETVKALDAEIAALAEEVRTGEAEVDAQLTADDVIEMARSRPATRATLR